MLASFLIVLRELIEAGLIIGIMAAATRSLAGRGFHIGLGIGLGVGGAGLVALMAGVLSQSFEGMGQEWFNVAILATAVVMLMWHSLWMSSHARELSASMHQLGHALEAGQKTMWALTVVVALAIVREGTEVVLFLNGLLLSAGQDGQTAQISLLFGGIFGLLAGVALSYLMYHGLIHLPVSSFFKITNGMVMVLQAGLAAQMVNILEQIGVINWGITPLWNTQSLLSETSVLGRALHTLIGYRDQPTGAELLVYCGVLGLSLGLGRYISAKEGQSKEGQLKSLKD